MINDSGERTEFSTGAVRDLHEGKGRFDLLPLNAVWAVAKHCERGALKYGEHNVDKGIPVHSLFDSAIRHAFKWFLGWDDEQHLEAACWNLLWALEMCLMKPEMDDRPEVGFQARTDALLTNADKIRMMDDDELAVFLGNTKAFCCRDRDPSEEFIAEFKEWLAKEADTNDS